MSPVFSCGRLIGDKDEAGGGGGVAELVGLPPTLTFGRAIVVSSRSLLLVPAPGIGVEGEVMPNELGPVMAADVEGLLWRIAWGGGGGGVVHCEGARFGDPTIPEAAARVGVAFELEFELGEQGL